jgi:hypothetical protein
MQENVLAVLYCTFLCGLCNGDTYKLPLFKRENVYNYAFPYILYGSILCSVLYISSAEFKKNVNIFNTALKHYR